MAVNPATLSNPDQVRNLLNNAKRLGKDALVFECQIRIGELAGEKFEDAVEREFWTAIAFAEELLTVENGKATKLSRTRQKVQRVGFSRTVNDLAAAATVSDGFLTLVNGGRPDLTAEAIVLRHVAAFEPAVRDAARAKLDAAGVDIDSAIALR